MLRGIARLVGLGVAAGLMVGATALQSRAQEAACGLGQDEILGLVRAELAPGSNITAASEELLNNVAARIAGTSPECALDVVVAVCTVRPDATTVGLRVGNVVADRAGELQIAAQGVCGEFEPLAPAAGAGGVYEGPSAYRDSIRDSDEFEVVERDVSPS